jgi:hypothetical protein
LGCDTFVIIEPAEEKDNERKKIDITPNPSPEGEGNCSAGNMTIGG